MPRPWLPVIVIQCCHYYSYLVTVCHGGNTSRHIITSRNAALMCVTTLSMSCQSQSSLHHPLLYLHLVQLQKHVLSHQQHQTLPQLCLPKLYHGRLPRLHYRHLKHLQPMALAYHLITKSSYTCNTGLRTLTFYTPGEAIHGPDYRDVTQIISQNYHTRTMFLMVYYACIQAMHTWTECLLVVTLPIPSVTQACIWQLQNFNISD